MQISSALLPSLLAVIGGSITVSAVCTGNSLAIGTAGVNTSSGQTSYSIYTASSCALQRTVSVPTSTPCDNAYFFCQTGTTSYQEYDDPVTGQSYLCAADATAAEKCGSDTISLCCSPGSVAQ